MKINLSCKTSCYERISPHSPVKLYGQNYKNELFPELSVSKLKEMNNFMRIVQIICMLLHLEL